MTPRRRLHGEHSRRLTRSPIPDRGPRKSSQLHEKRPRAVLEVNFHRPTKRRWQGMMGAAVQRIWRTIKKRRFAGSGCPPPAHPYPGLKLCGRPLSVSPPLSLRRLRCGSGEGGGGSAATVASRIGAPAGGLPW